MPDITHVLLMLSSAQPPNPIEEVQWHVSYCRDEGRTAVATTHLLSGLTRGKSIVAFYGDTTLANQYLGHGVFAGFAKSDQPRGKELLNSMPLYSNANRPKSTRGLVELTDFRLAMPGEGLESLAGKIKNTFQPLALESLPEGPARACVYFIRRGAR